MPLTILAGYLGPRAQRRPVTTGGRGDRSATWRAPRPTLAPASRQRLVLGEWWNARLVAGDNPRRASKPPSSARDGYTWSSNPSRHLHRSRIMTTQHLAAVSHRLQRRSRPGLRTFCAQRLSRRLAAAIRGPERAGSSTLRDGGRLRHQRASVFWRRASPCHAVDDTPVRLAGVRRSGRATCAFPSTRRNCAGRLGPPAFADAPFRPDMAVGRSLVHPRPRRAAPRTGRAPAAIWSLSPCPTASQVGLLAAQMVIDREFFAHARRRLDRHRAHPAYSRRGGRRIVDQGVLDVPPWPDTVMPAAEVLKRLGVRSAALADRFTGDGWHWSTMAYYLGKTGLV